jgi:hypothetical protein
VTEGDVKETRPTNNGLLGPYLSGLSANLPACVPLGPKVGF